MYTFQSGSTPMRCSRATLEKELVTRRNRLDPRELVVEGMQRLRGDRIDVHGGAPEVADAARAGLGEGPVGLRSGVLVDSQQPLVRFLLHRLIDPPGALVGRNRMLLEPLADGELEEVVARVGAAVDERRKVLLGVHRRGDALRRRQEHEHRERESGLHRHS